MKDEKEIVWTDDMGFMPPVVRTEGRTICRYECQLTEYKTEIERLRLREETLSGIIDGMTARFIEAQKAVEEIERLRGEVMAWWKETEIMRSDLAIYSEQIERQQKALQWIAGCEGGDIFDMCKEMRDTANAALKEGE